MTERRALFISHASPEDDAFTIWLGAKLSALGYEVWADVLRLSGGEDWERKLECAIRERTCKVLLAANAVSVSKQGVRNELHIASDVGQRIGDAAFIIPLRLGPFDAPFVIAQAQYIDFEPSWALGLQKLIKDLDDVYGVPRTGAADPAIWTSLQVLHGKPVVQRAESLISNWLEVRRLPAKLCYLPPNAATNLRGALGRYPSVEYGDGLLSGESADLPETVARATADFLQGGWPDISIGVADARNIFAALANQALSNLFDLKGLKRFDMANRQVCWWLDKSLPDGRITFRWPNISGSRRLQGHSVKRNVFWHFGATTAFRCRPFPHARFKSRLLFTENGLALIKDPRRMHRLRRSFAKGWRNARWRDMVLAFLYWVGDGQTVLTAPFSSEGNLVLSLPPLSFSSPVAISDASGTDVDSDDPEVPAGNDEEEYFDDTAAEAEP